MVAAARLSLELVAELHRLQDGLNRAIGMVDKAGNQMTSSADAAGRGMANGFMRSGAGIAVAGTALAAVTVAVGLAAGAFWLFRREAGRTEGHEQFAKSLGMTSEEIERAGGAATHYKDVLAGLWKTIDDRTGLSDFFKDAIEWAAQAMETILGYAKQGAALLYAAFLGEFDNLKMLWQRFPAIVGDGVISSTNFVIENIEKMVNFAIKGLNKLIGLANSIASKAGMKGFGELGEVSFGRVNNPYAGAAEQALADKQGFAEKRRQEALNWMDGFGADLGNNIDQATRNRLQAAHEANQKKKKTSGGKSDKAAEALAREVEAIKAAIKGLYDLAAAYGVSDAAAMRAEATAKAHEKAIRKQADVDMFVALELQRAVAERVKDAAKTAADLRYQASLQEQMNKEVRTGALDIGRMGERMSDLAAARELQAAIDLNISPEATAAATKALADLTKEQKRNNDALREAEDLRRADQAVKEIAEIERLTEANAKLGEKRFTAMTSGLGGFALQQELATINAEHEKYLIDSRAHVEIEQARKDGLYQLAEALEKKRIAEKADVDQALQLETMDAAMRELQDISNSIDFAGMFGRGGEAVRDMIDAVHSLTDAQAAHRAAVAAAAGDQAKIAKADALYRSAQIAGNLQMIGSVKGVFKERSAGYKAITAIEKAYALWEMANRIKSMVMDKALTVDSMANAGQRAAADQAAGASKIFSQLGMWAFPVVGAMIAVLASLGMKGGKGGGGVVPPSPEELQASFGTGTVFGAADAQSESIARSLEIIAANTNADLEFSNQALRTLRSIDGGISQLAGQLGQQIGLGAAGMFDTSRLGLGINGKSGVLGIGGKSTTRNLYDQGLQIYGQSVSQILAGNFNAQVYNVVEQIKKKKGVFGIGGGTKTSYNTSYGAIDAEIRNGFAEVLRGVADGVVSVTGLYSTQMADDLRGMIERMQLPGVKFSTQGMSLDEIEKALQSYFGSVADQIAGLAAQQMPVLNELRRAGEGMFETLTRVVKTFGTVNIGLSSIGMGGFAQGDAGLRGASELSDLFGDLDAYQDAISKFGDKFLTEAERMEPIINAVRTEMERLGHSGVVTTDQFKALVLGMDLSSAAGREMFAELMAVAPAFAKIIDYMGALDGTVGETAALINKRRSLEIQIMELQGRTAEALAAKRAQELDALEEVLRPMQLYIYALQDEAAAKSALKSAWERESKEIITLRDKFADLGKTLRDYRETLIPAGATGSAYGRAERSFVEMAAAARLGDAEAMQGLSQISQSFLSASMDNARSQLDYLRDMARVTQAVDDAIGAADEAVDYQQAQMDALQELVARHIDLNENVLSVRDAILALEATQQGIVAIGADLGSIPVVATVPAPSNGENAALRAEVASLSAKLDRIVSAAERGADAGERTNSHYLSRVVDNDAIRVREDS